MRRPATPNTASHQAPAGRTCRSTGPARSAVRAKKTSKWCRFDGKGIQDIVCEACDAKQARACRAQRRPMWQRLHGISPPVDRSLARDAQRGLRPDHAVTAGACRPAPSDPRPGAARAALRRAPREPEEAACGDRRDRQEDDGALLRVDRRRRPATSFSPPIGMPPRFRAINWPPCCSWCAGRSPRRARAPALTRGRGRVWFDAFHHLTRVPLPAS